MQSSPFPDVKAVIRAVAERIGAVPDMSDRAVVAALFECSERAVLAWEQLNYLPAKHYKVIRDLLGAELIDEGLFSFTHPAIDLPAVVSAHQ